ncbi:PIN/TRAM domain-containing protein [Zavarzinella formosa]|uniref:PIN/TRAM domain-containing protein n=1 Tax=Zavarzinella formosa TaxID=360055 RepID=UPI0002FAAB93|nr:TRAM domain-containing protein [Zavarzinella formosa]
MLLWLLRGLFAAFLLGLGIAAFDTFAEKGNDGRSLWLGFRAMLVVLAVGGVVLFTDLWERNKQISTLSALYFGLLLGLLLGWLFSMALERFLSSWFGGEGNDPIMVIARMFITVVCCYITISTLLQTKDEFRFIIPYVEFAKQTKGNKPLILDTSVIIDGRIADLCDTRLVDSKLIVTRFVLQELQSIADSSDKLKRNRGRRGLDILKKLQGNSKIELIMHDGNVAELRELSEKVRVDERLVLFAKAIDGRVVTNDFNLNKIAQLQGVDVINLNEVANSLKTVALPGEILTIKLVKPGDQPGQGIGYLEDGTMVVVEQGRVSIGQEVGITVTSVLQTPAGRMIFGRIDPQRPPGTVPPTAEARALDK